MQRTNLILKTLVMFLLTYGLYSCSKDEKEEFTPAQSQQKLILAALESN